MWWIPTTFSPGRCVPAIFNPPLFNWMQRLIGALDFNLERPHRRRWANGFSAVWDAWAGTARSIGASGNTDGHRRSR